MKKNTYLAAKQQAITQFDRAHIVLTEKEKDAIEVADFGLDDLARTGLQILTYVNTERCCAKELVMTPNQTCPEHRHPMMDGQPGKEETFRCRAGTVSLFVPGRRTAHPKAVPPQGDEAYYTVYHEIVLNPGDQYTLAPDTLHWFQAGPLGAIVSEFSTASHDESDVFTDPRIQRVPVVE